MSKVSEAYVLADHIHRSFFGVEATLPADIVESSGVDSQIGSVSSTTSQRIEVHGELDGKTVNQTLARDKLGNFHFASTCLEYGGELTQANIYPHSSIEVAELLTNTVFIKKLVAIALTQE